MHSNTNYNQNPQNTTPSINFNFMASFAGMRSREPERPKLQIPESFTPRVNYNAEREDKFVDKRSKIVPFDISPVKKVYRTTSSNYKVREIPKSETVKRELSKYKRETSKSEKPTRNISKNKKEVTKAKIENPRPKPKVSSQYAKELFERNSNSGVLNKPQVITVENTDVSKIGHSLGLENELRVPIWFQTSDFNENVISDEAAECELMRFNENPVFDEYI